MFLMSFYFSCKFYVTSNQIYAIIVSLLLVAIYKLISKINKDEQEQDH